jgi:hypothetical protein
VIFLKKADFFGKFGKNSAFSCFIQEYENPKAPLLPMLSDQ